MAQGAFEFVGCERGSRVAPQPTQLRSTRDHQPLTRGGTCPIHQSAASPFGVVSGATAGAAGTGSLHSVGADCAGRDPACSPPAPTTEPAANPTKTVMAARTSGRTAWAVTPDKTRDATQWPWPGHHHWPSQVGPALPLPWHPWGSCSRPAAAAPDVGRRITLGGWFTSAGCLRRQPPRPASPGCAGAPAPGRPRRR